MATNVLELNDSELRVASGTRIVARSPGHAVILDDALHLGTEALKRAHLFPRQCYSRFWAYLNQDALAVPARRFRHHADIAFAHLKHLHEQAGKPAEMILAVPGSWSSEQLSLLLGLVQAVPFRAIGLVDSAVAATAAVAGPGRWLHLEMLLHQTVLTRLAIDAEVARESVETLDNGGISAVHDAVAGLIADLFIQQCRFDPLHYAETEQALYDQIPGCLGHLHDRPEVLLEIRYRDARNQVKLSRAAVLERLDDFYQGILAQLEPDRRVLVGARAASLPGFAGAIPGAAGLPPEAVFRGCEEHRAAILGPGPHLGFVTRLPLAANPVPELGQAAPTTAAPTAAAAPAATHILIGCRALPLRAAPLYLSARGSVFRAKQEGAACSIGLNSRQAVVTPLRDVAVYVNGERIAGPTTLVAGDRIGFAGSDATCTLIRVDEGDAA
jgi:hypothetical protein